MDAGAWDAPGSLRQHQLALSRVWATVIAVFLTVFLALLLKASHPPAAATALLVTLGAIQTGPAALNAVVGIVLISILAELFRQIRRKAAKHRGEPIGAEPWSSAPELKPRPA